jgi:hypothetical protein
LGLNSWIVAQPASKKANNSEFRTQLTCKLPTSPSPRFLTTMSVSNPFEFDLKVTEILRLIYTLTETKLFFFNKSFYFRLSFKSFWAFLSMKLYLIFYIYLFFYRVILILYPKSWASQINLSYLEVFFFNFIFQHLVCLRVYLHCFI